jgi:hypothetical protein
MLSKRFIIRLVLDQPGVAHRPRACNVFEYDLLAPRNALSKWDIKGALPLLPLPFIRIMGRKTSSVLGTIKVIQTLQWHNGALMGPPDFEDHTSDKMK